MASRLGSYSFAFFLSRQKNKKWTRKKLFENGAVGIQKGQSSPILFILDNTWGNSLVLASDRQLINEPRVKITFL